ncbi:unnamed protein product [Arabidopsis lyrata]|nr:unnamed protein product [Arabidopsis lyrata]
MRLTSPAKVDQGFWWLIEISSRYSDGSSLFGAVDYTDNRGSENLVVHGGTYKVDRWKIFISGPMGLFGYRGWKGFVPMV